MSTTTYKSGSIATLLSTELNSLANNSLAIASSAYDNSVNLYLMGEIEFTSGSAFSSAPTSNTGLSIWFLRDIDGTDYEDGGSSLTPVRMPDLVIPLEPQISTAQRITRRVPIPPGTFKTLVKNDGTGQALPSSGNTLKILPLTYQST